MRLASCVLVAAVLAAAGAGSAGAGARAAKLVRSAIPAGDGWYCWSGGCARTEQECDDDFQLGSSGLSDETLCERRKTATVFTYYNDSYDAYVAEAFPSVSQCKKIRAAWFGEYKRVSACKVIGKISPPKLDRTLLPEGKDWHCASGDTDSTRCYRSDWQCRARTLECTEQDDAWAFSEAPDLVLVFVSKRTCDLARFARASRCERVE